MGVDGIYGTLDLLILSTLEADSGHGLAVKNRIEASSDGRIVVEVGALYPALRRLEARGLVEARWGTSAKGRRARIYQLTRPGQTALADERAKWSDHVDAMRAVVGRVP